MPDVHDAAALAAFQAALAAGPLDAAARERLAALARQVREDAAALAALDLDGVEPEPFPFVDRSEP